MSSSIEALIPELQEACRALVDVAGRAGVQPRITSTLRTYGQQARLYKRYLSGGSPYPAAPPGSSAHEFGYAFDMIVVGADNQDDLGQVWESWGGVWGGRGRDPIHFELAGWTKPERSLVSTLAVGLATPTPVAIGVTLGQAVSKSPVLSTLVNEMLGMGLPIADFWDWELGLLPSWLRESLSLF